MCWSCFEPVLENWSCASLPRSVVSDVTFSAYLNIYTTKISKRYKNGTFIYLFFLNVGWQIFTSTPLYITLLEPTLSLLKCGLPYFPLKWHFSIFYHCHTRKCVCLSSVFDLSPELPIFLFLSSLFYFYQKTYLPVASQESI